MGKSKQGGVFGYLRGKVGSVSYSVLSSQNSGTGSKLQVVRSLPESVSNPQTVGQCMQRMKLAPAQMFYKAFSELLSNAFQGVDYGNQSRQYFMSKAMEAEGPYVQRGVDRFIPAAYPFSEGSLPSIGIEPFAGGAQVITLAATTEAEAATVADLVAALGITEDYQLTVAVVNNVNGIFVPSYIPYTQRLTFADVPAAAVGVADGHYTINPAALGLDMSAMVACAIVISRQDASGSWLRSTQEMIISNELRNSLYSADALEAAIYSYQDGTNTVNSINSEWYYNLGMSQAWGGKLTTTELAVNAEGEPGNAQVVVGLKQLDGRITRTVFATSTEDTGLIICVGDNGIVTYPAATVGEFRGFNVGYTVEQWQDSYAAQLGFMVGAV